MNKFKTIFGFIMLVLGVVAAYWNFLLQEKLDDWRSFGDASVLYYVGRDMWVLVPIIYVFCVLFMLIGMYFIGRELNTL